MKKQGQILFAVIFLTGFCTLRSDAQTDSCAIKLKNANTGYDQGDYDGTIKLLQSALQECGLDKNEKIQANKLLIMSYLKVDNLEAADNTAADIMKIDPYYKPDKFKDDPKLSALFEKYQPTPVFRIGISAGINRTIIKVERNYSIVHNDEDAADFSEYNSKTGFQLGAQAEYRAYKNLWIELGGLFRQSQYEHILDSVENTTINYSEKLSYFDVPLSVKYYIMDNTFAPYVEAGATFSFMTNALSTTERDDQKDIVNRTDYRNTYMTGFFGGAGVAYRMKGISVFVAFRYNYYGDNVNEEGTRYADQTNVFKYYYIDDDFRMDNWQINLGVNYTISYKNKIIK
jgi:hypothetical protein